MVIITRKRIKLILSCILISLFTFAVSSSNKTLEISNTNRTNINITAETTATPASEKTIIIDAGHGEPDRRCY